MPSSSLFSGHFSSFWRLMSVLLLFTSAQWVFYLWIIYCLYLWPGAKRGVYAMLRRLNRRHRSYAMCARQAIKRESNDYFALAVELIKPQYLHISHMSALTQKNPSFLSALCRCVCVCCAQMCCKVYCSISPKSLPTCRLAEAGELMLWATNAPRVNMQL